MIRGRRVVLLVIFILQFAIFNPKISAQEKIEPSDLWKEAIGQYSIVTLETQNPEILKPVKISILSKGLLDEIIPNQKIKVRLYLNKVQIQENELQSSQDGILGFAFVPTNYGDYRAQAENVTYNKPIDLSPLQFSIQKDQSLFDIILRKFFLPPQK